MWYHESMLMKLTMRLGIAVCAAVTAVGLPAASHATELREAYESAGPSGQYDRVLTLETGKVYQGGLLIGPVLSPLTWDLEGAAGEDVLIAVFVTILASTPVWFIPTQVMVYPIALLGSFIQALVFALLTTVYLLLMSPHKEEH